MKKLNLDNYKIAVKDRQGLPAFIDYEVKFVITQLLCHSQFGLNGQDIMEKAPLVKKIDGAVTDVILSEEEYREILGVLKRFKGFVKNDIPMLERVYNCPDNPKDGKNVVKFSDN